MTDPHALVDSLIGEGMPLDLLKKAAELNIKLVNLVCDELAPGQLELEGDDVRVATLAACLLLSALGYEAPADD